MFKKRQEVLVISDDSDSECEDFLLYVDKDLLASMANALSNEVGICDAIVEKGRIRIIPDLRYPTTSLKQFILDYVTRAIEGDPYKDM